VVRLVAALCLVVLAFGVAASGSRPARGSSRVAAAECQVSIAPFVPPASRPRYSLRIRVAPDLRTLTGSETVSFTPDLGTDRLIFRLWPNAAPYARWGAHLEVTRVVAGQQALSVSRPDATTLVINRPLAAGQSITVSMDWSLALPVSHQLRFHGGSSIRLGTFFPRGNRESAGQPSQPRHSHWARRGPLRPPTSMCGSRRRRG
jgi:hypothetical protein